MVQGGENNENEGADEDEDEELFGVGESTQDAMQLSNLLMRIIQGAQQPNNA